MIQVYHYMKPLSIFFVVFCLIFIFLFDFKQQIILNSFEKEYKKQDIYPVFYLLIFFVVQLCSINGSISFNTSGVPSRETYLNLTYHRLI